MCFKLKKDTKVESWHQCFKYWTVVDYWPFWMRCWHSAQVLTPSIFYLISHFPVSEVSLPCCYPSVSNTSHPWPAPPGTIVTCPGWDLRLWRYLAYDGDGVGHRYWENYAWLLDISESQYWTTIRRDSRQFNVSVVSWLCVISLSPCLFCLPRPRTDSAKLWSKLSGSGQSIRVQRPLSSQSRSRSLKRERERVQRGVSRSQVAQDLFRSAVSYPVL